MGRHSQPNDATREFALPYQPRHAAPSSWQGELTEWVSQLSGPPLSTDELMDASIAASTAQFTVLTPRDDDEPTTHELPMPGKELTRGEKWTIRFLIGGLVIFLLLALAFSSSI